MKTYAILLDAGFLKKHLSRVLNKERPTPPGRPALAGADDIVRFVDGLKNIIAKEMWNVGAVGLYRVFYYDAEPYNKKVDFPLSGAPAKDDGLRLEMVKANSEVIENLKNRPFFAVRLGYTVFRGWNIKGKILDAAAESGAHEVKITNESLGPEIRQKGVDARLGLDIATLSLKQFVDIIVVVASDADFASPMSFARKEGRQVLLATLGQSVHNKLRNSADVCIDDDVAAILGKAKKYPSA